jgi:hypothetical protein
MTRPFLSLFLFLLAAQIAVSTGAAETAPMSCSLLENNVLRLRVPHVMGNFSEEFSLAAPSSIATNKLAGVILDLRSADGENDGLMSATNYFRDRQFPLVILVNGQTRGAAATLAADLRTAGAGILVGNTNFAGPVRPDITVSVSRADETNFLADPFFIPAAPKPLFTVGTNEFMEFVDHTSEADLVRKRVKDGEQDDTTSPRVEPSQPVVRDPALARALDLFKALAALHPARG